MKVIPEKRRRHLIGYKRFNYTKICTVINNTSLSCGVWMLLTALFLEMEKHKS